MELEMGNHIHPDHINVKAWSRLNAFSSMCQSPITRTESTANFQRIDGAWPLKGID